MCKYCDEENLDEESSFCDYIPEFGKGYAIEHGDIVAFIEKKKGEYFLSHHFTPDDGYWMKMKINYCPMCGRNFNEVTKNA